MAPSTITEDLYRILEVDQDAPFKLIREAYRRLALKRHPDRNGSTQAFQLLQLAYDTLKDPDERQKYDIIYPSIAGRQAKPQSWQTPCSTQQPKSEAAQIAELRKSKEERAARWNAKRSTIESSIFGSQRRIRRFQQDIKKLAEIATAEAAAEAWENSWTKWMLTPLFKKTEENEAVKERKEREKQERRIQKDMNQRWLEKEQMQVQENESLLARARKENEAADACDDQKIKVIENKIWQREEMARRERERAEQERLAKIWREQQAQREREAQAAREAARQREKEAEAQREAVRKRQADERAAEAARLAELLREAQRGRVAEEEYRRRTRGTYWSSTYSSSTFASSSIRRSHSSTCIHEGWWDKIEGYGACSTCSEVWPYLLRCPGCSKLACPRCQAELRPSGGLRRAAMANPRLTRRVPSTISYDSYNW